MNSVDVRNFQEKNKRRILQAIQKKAPKWNINVKTRQKAFALFPENTAHVVSDRQRYEDLASYRTIMRYFNK